MGGGYPRFLAQLADGEIWGDMGGKQYEKGIDRLFD
jgi:hypothetical protein